MIINQPMGIHQKYMLDKLRLNDGMYIFKSPHPFSILQVVRSLRTRGYKIEWFKHVGRYGHANTIDIPRFIIVYFVNRRREAVQLIYKTYPKIVGKANYLKTFEMPILKNLKKMGTMRYAKDVMRRGVRDGKEEKERR